MRETQRLDKIISNCGLGTRREIKGFVRAGRVLVNGVVAKSPEMHINPYEDTIKIDGEEIEYKKYIYLMMNKPSGVITALKDKKDKTVFDILPEFYKQFELSPAGRLDKDTQGLLILTNDGESIHELLSPKKHVDKTYYAKLRQDVKEEDFSKVERGIDIGDYVTLPAKLERIAEAEVYITIHEGKFHQVKRMFEALDNKVEFLKRMSMGSLNLDPDLQLGEVRELTEEEIKTLLGNNF